MRRTALLVLGFISAAIAVYQAIHEQRQLALVAAMIPWSAVWPSAGALACWVAVVVLYRSKAQLKREHDEAETKKRTTEQRRELNARVAETYNALYGGLKGLPDEDLTRLRKLMENHAVALNQRMDVDAGRSGPAP